MNMDTKTLIWLILNGILVLYIIGLIIYSAFFRREEEVIKWSKTQVQDLFPKEDFKTISKLINPIKNSIIQEQDSNTDHSNSSMMNN